MSMAKYTLTEYPQEVLKHMRIKEDEHPINQGLSPQLNMRGPLVDNIREICEELKLSVITTHLSVHLLDRFMDAHEISKNQLKLTALSVILLAAKFEENDFNIPRIKELNVFAESRYSINIFHAMEGFMLKFFQWNVGTVTTAHFVEFFLMYGITPYDTKDGFVLCSPHLYHRCLWFSAQNFLDASLLDEQFLKWKCSLVAAACIACGRHQINIKPFWPSSLTYITGYEEFELKDIVELLLSYGSSNRFPLSEINQSTPTTPESGYISSNASDISPRMSK